MTLENSLESTVPPAYDFGQFQNVLCQVHGDMCKTPEICRNIRVSFVPEVQPEQIIGGDGGVPMNNGEYTEAGLDPFFSSLNF